MGVKQSKRSLDITEASTRGEIEGFGNDGRVEKIIDGVVEKVAANGHVDGELQNGGESHQNGMEPVQNGEAATVAAEVAGGGKVEKIDVDEAAAAEGAVNGQVENCEINGEAEKTGEEAKKGEEKKEKKKEKKEKVLKKKFSFRNFSFSKKDKSKPKEEKSPGKMDEAGIEETPSSPENEAVASPTSNDMEIPEIPEMPKAEQVAQPEVVSSSVEIPAEIKMEQPIAEKISEVVSSTTAAIVEDLPPPLPASPPPSEPVKEMQEEVGVKTESDLVAAVATSSSTLLDTAAGILKDAEQMAMETGKQIEEKATNLLKTVEEKAEESMKTAGEMITQKSQELAEGLEKALTIGGEEEEMEPEAETKSEEMIPSIPVDVGSLAAKAEETTDKIEESGGGESLADVPKDLIETVAEGNIEGVNPDSLDISEPLPPPPPPVEAATGE